MSEKRQGGGPRDRERTREALIEAAGKIIVENGLQAVTLDDVAAAAGVSKGGLLHHFPNKNALIEEIAADMLRCYDQEIEEFRRQDPAEPGAFTRAFLRSNVRCKDESAKFCNALVSDMRTLPVPLEMFRAHSEECQRRIENDGLDPTVASIIRYAAEGLMSASVWGMLHANYEEIVEELLRLAGASVDVSTS